MRVNGYWLWLALAAPSFAEVGFPGFLDSSQRYLRRTSINTYTCQCPPNPPQYYNLWKVLVEEYDAVGNLNTIVQETWAKAHSCSFDTGPAPNPPVTQTSRTNYRSCPGGTYGNLYVLDNPVGEPVSRPPDPNATTAEDVKQGGKPCEKGMAGYSFHAQLISLNITDTPVSYQPPKGPAMAFTATYNQKEAGLPSVFNFSNLGPNWTHNWLSFVIDDPADQSKNVAVFARGGGTETYLATNPGSGVVFLPNQKSQAQLVRISGTTYEKRFPDGSKEVFSRSDGAIAAPRRIFLTSVVDATGNAATLTYDGQLRLETVSDALGQVTTFSYEMVTDPRKITRVTDPFGRTAVLTYNPSGQLASIQDAIGLQSSFAYGPGNFINSLATPYGTTTFVYGENATSRWLTATDPLGQTEKIEYRDKAPGIAAAETVVPTGLTIANFDLDMYNTFYWDKHAYAQFPNDYTKARITRWMPSYPGLSGLVHSTKNPLESRVFYNYLPGQANSSPQPSLAAPDMRALARAVGRALDSGDTQLSTFNYNSVGRITESVDPVGRRTEYTYAFNEIDLTRVRQINNGVGETLFSATYNSQHLPLTTVDAAGQTTAYTYNMAGQPLTIRNPKNEVTTMSYNPQGYLQSVTGALPGSTTAFTYDAAGRVRTVTDSEGYVVTSDYDNLDRLTKQTFPDGTFRQTTYDRLSIGSVRDRLGRVTQYTNDALGRVTQIRDPLNRVIHQSWCRCGSLKTLRDGNGNLTTWNYDVQGRLTSKVYADGKGDTFVYEASTSRLKSKTDALGQTITYGYNRDNNLASISYTNPRNPTPNVTFAYDPVYNRRVSMTDGTGTTTYSYYPVNAALGAGRLQSVAGPLPNSTIAYTYDQLGRVVGRAINGAGNQMSMVYDALGRVTSEANPLGTFTTAYVNTTGRPSSMTYPNGQTTLYTYFSNVGDQRLQQIRNLGPGAVNLSRFDYTYDAEGQIQSWGQTLGAAPTASYALGYDLAGQLTSAALGGAAPKNFTYNYDPAGNRTNETINGAAAPVTVNALNQLVSRTGANPRAFAYDANGNMVSSNGVGRTATNYTYQWDAENRLVAILYPATNQRTELTYDGLGRRVKIVEKTGAVVNATRQFVWDGLSIVEERDGAGNLMKRFYSQGQMNGATQLFFARDHLGSVREVANGAGAMVVRYDYDPYGRRTLTSGADVADFGFTGHLHHAQSKLHFALYRPYDADSARWLSRDPIMELGGMNIYGYVDNQPLSHLDSWGLDAIDIEIASLVQSSIDKAPPGASSNEIARIGHAYSYGLRGSCNDESKVAAAHFFDAARMSLVGSPVFASAWVTGYHGAKLIADSLDIAKSWATGKYEPTFLSMIPGAGGTPSRPTVTEWYWGMLGAVNGRYLGRLR